jgi:hypothetical protein
VVGVERLEGDGGETEADDEDDIGDADIGDEDGDAGPQAD